MKRSNSQRKAAKMERQALNANRKCGDDPAKWNRLLSKKGLGVPFDGLKTGEPKRSARKYA